MEEKERERGKWQRTKWGRNRGSREREKEQMIAWNERGIEGGGRGGDKENRDGRGSE